MRQYTEADKPHVAEMAMRFHRHVSPPWPLDTEAMHGLLMQLPFVRVTGDGFIAGALMQNPISPGWIVAKEFLWWAEGSGPALMRAFRKWALANGANEIQWSCPPDARARRLFERLGAMSEAVYSEVV